MRQSKDYYKYIGVEVFMRVFNRNKAVVRIPVFATQSALNLLRCSQNDILAQHTFIASTMKHLLEHYDVLSATRIEAMRTVLARLESMAPPSRSSSDVVTTPDSPDAADDTPHQAAAPVALASNGAALRSSGNNALRSSGSPTRGDMEETAPKKPADKRIPIVVDAPTVNGGGAGGGYNPTALLAMLDEQQSDADKSSHVASAGKRKAKKTRKASVSAISPDALHELNAGVDDDSSGDESDALPPPAEPQPVVTAKAEPAKLHLDEAAVASILDARERNQWGHGAASTAQLPEHQSAKALVGTIAPAPSIAVADLDELRRQVQIMATSANADVDDDDGDNDAEETKLRAVPYKKRCRAGHVAPAPTAATNQLEDFRAQAQAMARARWRARARPVAGRQDSGRPQGGRVWRPARQPLGEHVVGAALWLERAASDRRHQGPHRLQGRGSAARAAIRGDRQRDARRQQRSQRGVERERRRSPQVLLATPTKNDPKRLRALAFTPSQPPSTGIQSQLADFKAQAEALAAQLRDGVADADDVGDDALSSGESARDDDDPADPASETTDTPPKHGSLRDPAEKQRPSAKKKAALLYTPKAPAPTGAAPELVDFRSQAMQLAEQLRSLADEGADDESSISSALSPPGSETPSLAPTLRYGEGVRAPAPTMKEKQLASYAAQAELLVAKLAEVERARKSEASGTARRHRSRSHKADGIAPDSTAAVAATTATATSSSSTTTITSSNSAAASVAPVAGAGVVERLRTAALVRKNSKGEIDTASGSNSPTTHSPRDDGKSSSTSVPNDKPQRRATKSKTGQTTTAAAAVAALVTGSGSQSDLTAVAGSSAGKEKSGVMRRSSVARPVERPAGRAPLPPRSDKDHMTAMEQETLLSAERAELKKKIDALEQNWAGKPKDQSVLHELMQLGLSLADVEAQLADLQDK
jgi:hypothetical protein